MKQNKLSTPNRAAFLAAFNRGLAFGLLAVTLNLGTATAKPKPPTPAPGTTTLSPGDIVRTDSGDPTQGPLVIKVDPRTGAETLLAQGSFLALSGQPMGVVLDQTGQMIVANEASLLRIDPQTGAQTMIRDTTDAPGMFWNLTLDRNGDILVAAETAILRVNPLTGDMQTVSSNGQLNASLSLALSGKPSGDIYATTMRNEAGIGWVGSIIQVDPKTGRQTVVSDGGYLGFLLGIAVQGDNIFVTTVKDHEANFGVGQVIRVDARTGIQTVVSEGGHLMRPAGISVDGSGQLVVADPYTMNPDSETLFDGAVIRIDPLTGGQALVSRGQGSSLNPCAVTVVADPRTR